MKKWIRIIGTILIAAAMLGGASHTYQAQAVTDERAAQIEEVRSALTEIVSEREVMALVYLCDEYPLREDNTEEGTVVVSVTSGQTVEIQDALIDEDGMAWSYVKANIGEQEYEGYIPRDYLAVSDERFLEWEDTYFMNPTALRNKYNRSTTPNTADIDQFPESYRAALLALKQAHPNWTFVKMNTGLDWNTVISNEMQGGRSLVYRTSPAYNRLDAYDNGNWYYASWDILSYYMDPRNALTEKSIFQFEQLTYNETYHTQPAVAAFLENTFMNSSANAPGTDMTYARIIWAIGAEKKVSPFHLAARIYQEQGLGTSPLISGAYTRYAGYYNYFNVGATGTTTTQVIENGLKYAVDHGWNSAYYSILGGAEVISANYIKKGQDTLYLQKYNVNPSSSYALYTHQYMQNIAAPTSEAASMYNLYNGAGSIDNTFVFKIPVFENMPAAAVPTPTYSTDVVLGYPTGYSDGTVYLDGVPYTSYTANGKHIVRAADGNAKTAVVYRYDGNGIPVGMYVWTLSYADGKYTVTAQPGLEDMLTYHGFSIRITGRAGIRFKTGISTSLRSQLLGEGVGGYKLKEYGSLIMNNANRSQYPMIKGGEKVLGGLAYGTDAAGKYTDVIYETVNDRYRYTAVLVGLPTTQYKVEYAFRGYAVLDNNGQQITVYGPIMARSIYSLAQQVLTMSTYPSGSEADVFLRKLVADGDAAQ